MRLQGARALVTGAASGLGRALSLELARRGAKVLLADLDEDGLDAVAAEVRGAGGEALCRRLDVREEGGWQICLEAARGAWGGLDLLVNNAGVADVGGILESTERAWERQLQVNLMGVARGCRLGVPLLVESGGGHVVNVASMAGIALAPGMIAYNTAKAGVVALSESLWVELRPHGIGVSVVCPAFFPTNLTASMDEASPEVVKRVNRWMESSGITVDDVVRDVLSAVEKDQFLVLTHPKTRGLWRLKRFLPDRYRARMLKDHEQRLKRIAEKVRGG